MCEKTYKEYHTLIYKKSEEVYHWFEEAILEWLWPYLGGLQDKACVGELGCTSKYFGKPGSLSNLKSGSHVYNA